MPRPLSRCDSLLILVAGLLLGPPGLAEPDPADGLRAEGTELVLALPDGGELRSLQLVGAELALPGRAGTRRIRLEGVRRQTDPDGGSVWLHRFVLLGPHGERSELCAPDAQGRRLGFPVPSAGGFELACTSGALGRCWLEQDCAPLTDGARCVERTRIPEPVDLDALARRHPALQGRLGPDCGEQIAWADPPARPSAHSQSASDGRSE